MGKLYVGNSGSTPAIIKVEEVAKKKFGVSIDNFLGDVDENGALLNPVGKNLELVFSGVKTINNPQFRYKFYQNDIVTSISFPDLLEVTGRAFYNSFQYSTSLEVVSFPKLEYIDRTSGFCFSDAFSYCDRLKSINFDSLKEVGYYGLNRAFYWCREASLSNISFPALRQIGENGMKEVFYYDYNLISIELPSVVNVSKYGLYNAFYQCNKLERLDLSSLETVGANGCDSMCYKNTSLLSVDLSSLKEISKRGMSCAFLECIKLSTINFNSLQSIAEEGLYAAFSGCTSLSAIFFPALINIQDTGLSIGSYGNAFDKCSNLTEIHFRADMQEIIEGIKGYSNKWGATNATVYFDL
jgi:hypothetical protein